MKRKWVAAIAAMMLIPVLMTGCKGSGSSQETAPAGETGTQTAEEATETKTEDADETGVSDSSEDAAAETKTAEATEETTFTYYLSTSLDPSYADSYNDLEVMKYFLDKAWDVDGTKKKISLDISSAPAGSESDNMNTLIATGEYADVIDMAAASDSPETMYEQGIVIDLTEYVEKYMPNYLAWADSHPQYAGQIKNDGKYLMLYMVSDEAQDPWSGFCYRRDWIVKYGKNPETGKAFTGGWNDDKTEWTDDVVFPSGGTDPIYISDWEWMLPILQEALEDQQITDGYAFQMMASGTYYTGDLASSFGGGMFGTYIDSDGIVKQGRDTEQARAYLECMRHWYEEGWMDPYFQEKSGESIWYMVDAGTVYAGKVGLWSGMSNSLGAGLDTGDTFNAGSCVFAAAQPINDVYGTAACKNVEPNCFYQAALAQTGICLTDKAEKKDIPALLTALDWLYGDGAMLHTYGLSKEEQQEAQLALYNEHGLENGAYYTEEEDGVTIYHADPRLEDEYGLNEAAAVMRLAGMYKYENVTKDRDAFMEHQLDQWRMYDGSGSLMMAPVANQLTTQMSDELAEKTPGLNTYCSVEVPKFITGEYDITSDADWETYCDGLAVYEPELQAKFYNQLLGNETE